MTWTCWPHGIKLSLFSLNCIQWSKTEVKYSFFHVISSSNCNKKLCDCLIICTISFFLYPLKLSPTVCLSSCFRNIKSSSGKQGHRLDSNSTAAGLLFHVNSQVIFSTRQNEGQCPVYYYCAQTLQKALSIALPTPCGFSIGRASKWLSMIKPGAQRHAEHLLDISKLKKNKMQSTNNITLQQLYAKEDPEGKINLQQQRWHLTKNSPFSIQFSLGRTPLHQKIMLVPILLHRIWAF